VLALFLASYRVCNGPFTWAHYVTISGEIKRSVSSRKRFLGRTQIRECVPQAKSLPVTVSKNRPACLSFCRSVIISTRIHIRRLFIPVPVHPQIIPSLFIKAIECLKLIISI